jgi:hypothetical protein
LRSKPSSPPSSDLGAGRCRSSGCAQVPSPRSRHLLPPTTFHAPGPRQRASQRPTNGGGVPRTERPQEHTMTFLAARRSFVASCGRHLARSSSSHRQWLRTRVRPAADERPPGVAGPVSNVLKHANDLIRYIDKCFAVVGRSADVCHSRVPLPTAIALSLRGVDRLAVGGA